MLPLRDEMSAYLLVREKFYASVRKYSQHGCRVPTKETERAILEPNDSNSFGSARPGAGVLLELRIRGLEEDLDAVKWCHHRLCLHSELV